MILEAKETLDRVLQEITGITDVQIVDGGEHADLATTVAFMLAKTKKMAPVQIAKDLAAEL